MNRCIVFLLILTLLGAFSVSAGAVDEFKPLELGDEIPMPGNIAFEVHDSCWEHDTFGQYHAREDGWFVVVSNVANKNGGDKLYFERAYVDIYNAEGVFQKELSLSNSDPNLTARLTETAVEIYLTSCYLSYDLATGEVTCHYTPNGYIKDSGLYTQLQKSKKQIGEWTYTSKGLPSMYRSLVREKDGIAETVVKLKGSSIQFPNILPYILSSAVVILVIDFVRRKLRKSKG